MMDGMEVFVNIKPIAMSIFGEKGMGPGPKDGPEMENKE